MVGAHTNTQSYFGLTRVTHIKNLLDLKKVPGWARALPPVLSRSYLIYLLDFIVFLTMFMKNSVHFLFINVIPTIEANFGKMNCRMNFGISRTLAYFGSL